MVMLSRQKESGAVSLFIVVFAMLLITIVTLSFLRIMISDQQQASVNDLSKSALDSAQAGVEDAKRALIYYRTVCASGGVADCATVRTTMNSTECNQGLKDVVSVAANTEVQIQQTQSANDAQLNQAYTCVKMQLDTDDYLGTIEANSSKVIPLISTGAFTRVLLEWFTTDDLGLAGTSVDLQRTPAAVDVGGTNEQILPLLAQASWPQTRPSVMRAQIMQYGTSFTLSDFDDISSESSNANTLFLYPVGVSGKANPAFDTWSFADRDIRQIPTGAPLGTRCSGSLSGGGYACRVQLDLPAPIGNSAGDTTRTAYLRLSALYKSTHFRISLDGTQFKGVQPSIDSTGRANEQYRRVETRVDLINTNFPFPEAALDVSGNVCKDFSVTDTLNTIPANSGTCS
jgi:Tfp pilus assembly protein PilX